MATESQATVMNEHTIDTNVHAIHTTIKQLLTRIRNNSIIDESFDHHHYISNSDYHGNYSIISYFAFQGKLEMCDSSSYLTKLNLSIQRNDHGKIDLLIDIEQFSQDEIIYNNHDYLYTHHNSDRKTFLLLNQTFQKSRYNECCHFVTCSIRGIKLDSFKRYQAIIYYNLIQLYSSNTIDKLPALKSLKYHPPYPVPNINLLWSLITSSDFHHIGFENEQLYYCKFIHLNNQMVDHIKIYDDDDDDNNTQILSMENTNQNKNQRINIDSKKYEMNGIEVNIGNSNQCLQWLSTQKPIRFRFYYILHHMIRWLHLKGEIETASWLYWESSELQPKCKNEVECREAFQKSRIVHMFLDKTYIIISNAIS